MAIIRHTITKMYKESGLIPRGVSPLQYNCTMCNCCNFAASNNNDGIKWNKMVSFMAFVVVFGATVPSGAWPPHSRDFEVTHNDAPQSVWLLWTSDQLITETSTSQHTTLTTDRHPCPRWDSNPQSQLASGRRPTRCHSDGHLKGSTAEKRLKLVKIFLAFRGLKLPVVNVILL